MQSGRTQCLPRPCILDKVCAAAEAPGGALRIERRLLGFAALEDLLPAAPFAAPEPADAPEQPDVYSYDEDVDADTTLSAALDGLGVSAAQHDGQEEGGTPTAGSPSTAPTPAAALGLTDGQQSHSNGAAKPQEPPEQTLSQAAVQTQDRQGAA